MRNWFDVVLLAGREIYSKFRDFLSSFVSHQLILLWIIPSPGEEQKRNRKKEWEYERNREDGRRQGGMREAATRQVESNSENKE